MQRRNFPDLEAGTLARLDFDKAAANYRLDFKFTMLAANPSSGEVWLGIGLRTVTWEGWASYLDLHIVGGKLDFTCGFKGITEEHVFAAERPAAKSGATLYARIDCRVNGNLTEYTIYGKTKESDAYEPYYRFTLAKSSTAGNAGAPVKAFQFDYRNIGGCYAIEDLTMTSYDA